jgi:16S rRNA (adenine1518-N6/adenine1519-N6)-dimethyltransferase
VFLPKPNVSSAMVDIRRKATPAVDNVDPKKLFALVRTGFGQRRKMLRRCLSNMVTPAQFAAAGVSPESRAEELDVADWGRLCIATQEA